MTRRDNAEREDHYHYGLMLAISSNSSDPATAHLALLWTHAVDNEAAAHIVKEAEELVRLLDADHICTCATEDGFRLYASVTGRRGASWSGKLQIAWPAAGGGGGVNDMQRTPGPGVGRGRAGFTHETSRVRLISACLAVHLDKALHEDVLHLLGIQGVLEAVAQQDDERQTLTQLVWASGWPRGPDAPKFVQHPVLGRIQPLQVPLGSARHGCGHERAHLRYW